MYSLDNPPEWATHVINLAEVVAGVEALFYNQERWLHLSRSGHFTEGNWEEMGLEEYLDRPVVKKAKIEEINIQLENE